MSLNKNNKELLNEENSIEKNKTKDKKQSIKNKLENEIQEINIPKDTIENSDLKAESEEKDSNKVNDEIKSTNEMQPVNFTQSDEKISLSYSKINNISNLPSVKTNNIYLDDKIREDILNSIRYVNKDIDLKILGKVLYNKKKYYCEIECKLFDSSYYSKYKKEEISDIDVYAIRFDESLSLHKAGFECKSTINNGVDEILKIKGIQLYNDFHKVGLFKKKISNNVRLIAEKLNVELYDETELKKIVSMIVPEYNKKVESEKRFYLIVNSIEKKLKLKIKGIISFTKGSYWTNSPEQNLHTIVRSLEHINSINSLEEYERVFIILRLSLLCSISMLEITSIIVKSNFSNIENCAIDRIFGGTTARWEKQRTYDLISQELGKEVSPYPYYIKDYINVISWMVSSLEDSARIPLIIEHYIKCYLLGMDYNVLSKVYSESTIKLSKDILKFTTKIIKDEKIFEHIYRI